MIVSIASGKGGTGKTTVATNLAVSVDGPVQLLDCDVEAPNAHLFLRPAIEETTAVFTPVPEIDPQKCKKCTENCRFRAITVSTRCLLCDADVDAADFHLLMQP